MLLGKTVFTNNLTKNGTQIHFLTSAGQESTNPRSNLPGILIAKTIVFGNNKIILNEWESSEEVMDHVKSGLLTTLKQQIMLRNSDSYLNFLYWYKTNIHCKYNLNQFYPF